MTCSWQARSFNYYPSSSLSINDRPITLAACISLYPEQEIWTKISAVLKVTEFIGLLSQQRSNLFLLPLSCPKLVQGIENQAFSPAQLLVLQYSSLLIQNQEIPERGNRSEEIQFLSECITLEVAYTQTYFHCTSRRIKDINGF